MTHEQVETALAIWEDMLHQRTQNTRVDDLFRHHGQAQMRSFCVTFAPWVDAVYAAMPDSKTNVPFDLEIVPAILDTIEWSPTGPTLGDPIETAKSIQL